MKNGSAMKTKTSFKPEAGSVLVEVAIMLPFLILLVLGAVDFSRVFFAAIELNNAVRAGAEYGARTTATATNTANIQSTVTGDAANLSGVVATSTSYCTCPGSSATVGCATTCAGYGKPKLYVSVTGTYTWDSLVNWPGLEETVALTRTVIMRAK
jgi:Flp pilus assembly protein TadG